MRRAHYFRDVIYAGLFFITMGVSHTCVAKDVIIDTPVTQHDYESIHQGILVVKAALFNAPCNLSFENKYTLTECGAGSSYRDLPLMNLTARTLVTLQFIGFPNGVVSQRYPILLLNGNNEIRVPLRLINQSSVRLEVNYE